MRSFKSFVKEEKPGLYANIHAKRARIKAGSGEKMRKPGSEGAPTKQDWKDAAKTAKEEFELDEVSAEVSKRVAQARDKSAENYKLTPTQSRRLKMGDKGGEPDLNAAKALKSAMKRGAKNVYGEEFELDEALRHKVAGAIGQFIGNKIDPVHGEIMRVHGEAAYRQAAYHIRKTLGDLHSALKKHLSTGNLQTEEVELDEVSADVAKRVAQRRDLDFRKMTPTETQKRRMGRGDWRADPSLQADKALKSAIKRGAKNVYGEEVEIEEAVSVKKQSYSWGKMVTVHHGSDTSYPLHPEHQAKIKALGDNEKTTFKDETGRHVTAHRAKDTIHLSGAGISKKTSVARSHFAEEVEHLEEKHRVQVTISDPNHTMVSKRGDKIQKHVRLAADDKEAAVAKAKEHYKKQGYKVHGAEHVGMIGEGKYGAFRLGPGVGRFSSRGRAQHQGLEDPRTGLPLGFSPPPKKDEPEKSNTVKKTQKEEKEKDDLPFTPDKPSKSPSAKAGKYGIGYSTVKHLARMALQKQMQKKQQAK